MSEKSATSPKAIVRTLPSLKELNEGTGKVFNWTTEELRKYDDLLDDYRRNVYRILKLRQALEEEESEV